MFEEADLIHAYTRAEAIADGVLVDVSAVAREAGIRWPVALAAAARARSAASAPSPPLITGADAIQQGR
jgi:hypothetical protein